jgi:hypothetical protein
MKCLKSTKTGKIIRVSDKEAYNSTSEWKFIPKSEWKEATRKPKVESVTPESTEVAEPIKSKKQLKKQKSDK